MEIIAEVPTFRLGFGREATSCLASGPDLMAGLSLPLLAGEAEERLMTVPEDAAAVRVGSFQVIRRAGGDVLGGFAALPCDGPAEGVAERLYAELLRLVGDQPLHRMWNFVPRINAVTAGREQYQSFNVGRCRAFRERFGAAAMEARLPAATAVGIEEPVLAVAFLSGRSPVTHFENPRQVPAYRYPEQYGPSSPSFARGSVVVEAGSGRRIGYLSGTSSIRGHSTVGEGSLREQFAVTAQNIGTILERMGFPAALAADAPYERSFRVYLRRPEDLDWVQERFARLVGEDAAARTAYLRADICRSPLLIEVEGVVTE